MLDRFEEIDLLSVSPPAKSIAPVQQFVAPLLTTPALPDASIGGRCGPPRGRVRSVHWCGTSTRIRAARLVGPRVGHEGGGQIPGAIASTATCRAAQGTGLR